MITKREERRKRMGIPDYRTVMLPPLKVAGNQHDYQGRVQNREGEEQP
jgi:hypothetical protein